MNALPDFDGLLHWERLNAWLQLQAVPGSGPVTAVERLTGGSQNNLFVLTRGGERIVLRRPPKHLRANSNETMLREARVLKALAGSEVPHPRLYAACADESVIGACFYLMAPLEGFSPIGALPGRYGTDPAWRAAMGPEFVRGAAALAAVDYKAAGLEGFGKADQWHARQVDRWRSQLEGYAKLPGYQGSSLPHVDEVGRWLADHLPADGRIGIIHGDYQFPNVMFSHEAPRITGLIDWELSTLGDPLLDLGWVLTSWAEPGDPPGRTPNVEPWDGFVPRAELVRLYGERTGRNMDAMPWFFVLACYKLGCILEGSYARAMAGQAPMDIGTRLHAYAVWLFTKARQLIAGT
ncbi:MAG: phosphotransferase family protein [Gammaproteobacteria bacterium]